jgi:hypothetical protein
MPSPAVPGRRGFRHVKSPAQRHQATVLTIERAGRFPYVRAGWAGSRLLSAVSRSGVRGDLLDLLVLLLEAAEGVHRGGHRAQAPGLSAQGRDQRQQRGRDPAAAAQQLGDVPGGGLRVQALQRFERVLPIRW